MADVFTRLPTKLAGVFTADTARLGFAGGVPSALVQNVNTSYMQAITRLYEVGGNGIDTAVYYVGGRSQGTLAIARVIGPTAIIGAYYRKYGNVCNARTNTITLAFSVLDCSTEVALPAGVAGPAALERIEAQYVFKFCVITQIGTALASQDMVVNESSQLMFSGMEYFGPD